MPRLYSQTCLSWKWRYYLEKQFTFGKYILCIVQLNKYQTDPYLMKPRHDNWLFVDLAEFTCCEPKIVFSSRKQELLKYFSIFYLLSFFFQLWSNIANMSYIQVLLIIFLIISDYLFLIFFDFFWFWKKSENIGKKWKKTIRNNQKNNQ